MRFTLIICTYKRPEPVKVLLNSIREQDLYPDEILIIDSSPDDRTEKSVGDIAIKNLQYFKVDEENRGLTKQRNFGISKANSTNEIICFLDDDTVLTPNYFKELIGTYSKYPEALGVGGYIIDETEWRRIEKREIISYSDYVLDGYVRKDSSRFLFRKKIGLLTESFPTFMPAEGHGRSVGFLPPSDKTYQVETFMGGVSSFRHKIFKDVKFSSYFSGYGLYEDTDFTLRCSKMGALYINTAAKLYHFHDDEGRPNKFKYGKMVVRNGWYVWRVKNTSPKFISTIKWHLISWTLILIRLTNVLTSKHPKEALTESIGRVYGWGSLFVNEPKHNEG